MSNTLIVFEEIPESLYYYLIPNDEISLEQRELFNKVSGQLINVDDTPELEEMDHLLATEKFQQYKTNSKTLTNNITHVYSFGFAL